MPTEKSAAVDRQHVPFVLAPSGAQRRGQERPVGLRDQGTDRPADDRLGRQADQLGEAAIAIEDVPDGGQGERALLHLLHEHPVGLLGGLEREQLGAVRALDHERVDLALPDRAQRVLGFLQLPLELLDLLWIPRVVRHAGRCHACVTRSSPSRTRPVLDISPMIRRWGKGNAFTQVGAAMICSPAASDGRS